MNKFDEYLRQKAEEEKTEIPEYARVCIDQALSNLPDGEPKVRHIRILPRIAAAAACIAFVALFALPNASVAYARALEKVPVIGSLIRVVTIRNYFYSDDRHEMDIEVPAIENEDSSRAVQKINQDVSELTDRLVDQFYKELEIDGNSGYGSIYMDYETVTNTDRWFTLKITMFETAASSDSSFKYYHIDKQTGEIVTLEDLFADDDFTEILTKEIKRQMKQKMKEDSNLIYWVEDSEIGEDIVSVSKDHNFYFNEDGELVIPFDKYEVAPGYMGCPEFVIGKDVIQNIVKDEYADIIS